MRILHQKLKRCQKQQFANNLSLSHLPFQKWHTLLRPVLSVLLDKNYSLVGILLCILPLGDVQIEFLDLFWSFNELWVMAQCVFGGPKACYYNAAMTLNAQNCHNVVYFKHYICIISSNKFMSLLRNKKRRPIKKKCENF